MSFRPSRIASAAIAAIATAVVTALAILLSTGSPAAAQEDAEFTCASDAGTLTWTAADAETYWIYRSTDGGTTFQWLGRASTDNVQDPAPRTGVQYQVHYVGIPRSNCTITAEPAPSACSTGVLEAEQATLAGRFVASDDQNASGGASVSVPRGTGGAWNGPRTNFVEFCATVAEAGTYRIDARVKTANAVKRSFYVTVDDGQFVEFVAPAVNEHQTVAVNDAPALDPLNGPNQNRPTIDTMTWDLEPGDHYVRFHLRRDGVRLDNIELVNTVAPQPSGCLDCDIVRAIYDQIPLAQPSGDPCGWSAVTCSGESPTVVTEVSFAYTRSITELPAQIGDLTNLVSLNLDGAGSLRDPGFRSLPPEIGNLTNLEMLDVSGNRLQSLPPQIGNLTNLRVLGGYGNGYTELPPEIGNLTNLEVLAMSVSRLTSLPPEIGRLTSLQRIDLGGSEQLASLPPEIGDLTNLENLNLLESALTTLPDEIGELTNLRTLDVSYNRLTGDITALAPLLNNTPVPTVLVADGEGGNNCLTTTSAELAAYLGGRDWDRCDP